MIAGDLDVLDGAGIFFEDGIHIELAFAIGFKRVVVAVEKKIRTGQEAGVHAHAFAGVGFDKDETFPLLAIAFDFGFQLLEKSLLELQNFLNVHPSEQRMSGGDGGFGEEDVLKLVVARRKNGSALVYFGGIEEIENGQMLNCENPVHAFNAEAALTVQEVRNVSLFEASLLGQAEAGEVAFLDPLPKCIAQIFLQHPELHRKRL